VQTTSVKIKMDVGVSRNVFFRPLEHIQGLRIIVGLTKSKQRQLKSWGMLPSQVVGIRPAYGSFHKSSLETKLTNERPESMPMVATV